MTVALEHSGSATESVITPYSYQRDFVLNPARFMIVMWSRQSGKSMGAALKVNDDILGVEAEGRRTLWTVVSRSLSQARELAIKIRDVAKAIEAARKILLAPKLKRIDDALDDTKFELTYPGGSRVIVVSGNPDAAAGFSGNVLWDEAALTKRNRELFVTAFPVVSRGGFKFLIISTPRAGWFQKKVQEEQKRSMWHVEKLTIHDAVAQGCPQDPDELRAALNDDLAWKQEYLCEFVDDDICWLPWELLTQCTSDQATVELSDFDGPVYAGWDIARWHHLSVLWLVGKTGNQLRTLGIIAMQRRSFDEQYATIEQACRRYPKFTRLCLDQGGMGEAPFEEMKKRLGGGSRVEGIKFQGVKEILAQGIRGVMEERNLLIPDDHDVRDDLHSIRCTMTAAGNKRFEGEVGDSHADRFWAAALAVHAAISGGGPAKPVFTPAYNNPFLAKGGIF